MDPLSILASVAGISTAAAQIVNAISSLRHFGELPSRIYAIKNEVSDLQAVLLQIESALRQKTLAPNNAHGSLARILERTNHHLLELGKSLERIGKACNGGRLKYITKSAIWVKEQSLFQRFRNDIRSVKTTLTLMLGASNS